MYPIKNMFTGKILGQFGMKDGRLQVEGDFPQKAEMLDLATHASAIRGERFEQGIRDEQVLLDPAKDLDRVANFVNGNLADHSIRIINYTEEDEDLPDEDMEDMVKVQSHTREGGKVHVDEYERHEPGNAKEQSTEDLSKEIDELLEKTKQSKTLSQIRIERVDKAEQLEAEMKELDKQEHEFNKLFSKTNDFVALTKAQIISRKKKRLKKQLEELERQIKESVLGKPISTEDVDKALQECVSTKIPIFKQEHPDWSDEHVQAAAYGYCRDKLGMKDQQFRDGKIEWESSFGTKFTIRNRNDVERISRQLAGESDIESQEFGTYFEKAGHWKPILSTVYHGSNVPPSRILKEGLDAPFLTPNIDIAKNYGEYVYEINVSELPDDFFLSLSFEGEEEEMGTPDIVPAKYIKISEDSGIVGSGTTKGKKIAEEVKEEKSKSGEVHVSAHTREGGKVDVQAHTRSLPTKDQSFTLLKDSLAVGHGTVFADGTVVLHTPTSIELYGNTQRLSQVHAGTIQFMESKLEDKAYQDCPRRKALLEDSNLLGYTTPQGYLDHTAEITQSHAIKGITVADVILAREMIQDYHVSELPPWIRDQIGNKEFVRVLKPYEELEQTFSGMTELPTTQFHVEDSFPSMDSPVVLSAVKHIRADPKCRCIRGKIYFVEKNWPAAVMDSVKRGEITAVSIGGSTEFGPGGTFNGQIYDLKQVHIKGGHLAVLPGAEGRCPKGLCGVNLKDAKNSVVGIANKSNGGHVKGHFNNLELTVPTFSQAIFAIADSLKSVIDIKGHDQIEDHTLITEDVDSMPDNEIVQKLQDALAAKNQELLKVTTELSTFKDSATAKKLKEMEVESTAVKDQFAALQKENAKLKDDAAKLEVRVKEADTFRHSMYDRALLCTPFYKGKEKELAAMPLDEKAIVFRTAQNLGAVQLADAAILADGFPKPSEAQRQQFMDSGGKSRPKMPSAAFETPKEGAK